MSSDHKDDLHYNGVHVECRPAGQGNRGDGTHRKCTKAGGVERIHGHDFDGPLVYGCLELGQ